MQKNLSDKLSTTKNDWNDCRAHPSLTTFNTQDAEQPPVGDVLVSVFQ